MNSSAESWAAGPLVALDVETTGTDPHGDRIVTVAVITISPGQSQERREVSIRTWLADPGVDIPTEVTDIHGISTEQARRDGRPTVEVIAEATAWLAQVWTATTPLCAFNAAFDLTMLDAELRRHHGRGLPLGGPVIDPLCIDHHLDPDRAGRRNLAAVCAHYKVRLEGAHTSEGDALGAARLAWRLASTQPDRIGLLAPHILHSHQARWYRDREFVFADKLDRKIRYLRTRGGNTGEVSQLLARAGKVRASARSWPLLQSELPGRTRDEHQGAHLDGVDTASSLRDCAAVLLRALAGGTAILREDQWKAIEALVAHRRRALVVQRTGWGKSAVYFLATALLRARGAGPAVIISPLLALMRNQIAAAAKAGIHAVTMNSANPQEWDQVQAAVASGEVDVLLVSPERLNNPDFRDNVLPKLTASTGLLVVDEAHCISDWGHDFRPDYRRLRALLGELPEGVPVLATTATANDRVIADVADQLGIGTGGDTMVLRGSLDRESLRLSVCQLPTAQARLAWLTERLAQLPGSGIIYTLTVAAAHDVAGLLSEHGYPVAAYTGKTDPADRQAAEDDLLANRVKALVATSALGMGFDKPDLGFVIHLGAPSSPIAYYQQVGRAGRGVEHAEVVLLPGEEDRAIWDYFGSLAFPDERRVAEVLTTLARADRPLSTAALEPAVELSHSRLEMVLKVLDVDGAVRRVQGGWESTGLQWRYDRERYARVSAARDAEQQAMLGYLDVDGCRMEYLRRQLDDPGATPCGRCDNCTGKSWDTAVAAGTIEATRKHLRRPGVEVAPRKQWPAGMASLDVPLSGRIAADEQAEMGRVLGRLTDLGWGTRLRELVGASAADAEVPDSMLQACVQVLASWSWAQRPSAVVEIPSATRPRLTRSIASQLAIIGRLDFVGTLTVEGPPPRRANSAQRLADLWRRFSVSEEIVAAVSGTSGPILLIDDLIDTGWTMTVATRLLRRAGASSVLPFALASTA